MKPANVNVGRIVPVAVVAVGTFGADGAGRAGCFAHATKVASTSAHANRAVRLVVILSDIYPGPKDRQTCEALEGSQN